MRDRPPDPAAATPSPAPVTAAASPATATHPERTSRLVPGDAVEKRAWRGGRDGGA